VNAEPVAKAFFVIDDSHYRDFGIRNLRTLSLPIALYRLQATFFDGMPGFWCIDGLDLEFAPL